MSPFVSQSYGLKWFQGEFPATNPKYQEETGEIWKAYLTPTLLSTGLATGKGNLGLIGYQPHLVTRQFRLSQFRPNSLYKLKRHFSGWIRNDRRGYHKR